MSSASMIVLCASALFVQTISAECQRAPARDLWIPAPAPISWAPDCGAANYGAANYGAANYGAGNYGAANYDAANYGAANYGNIVASNMASASGGGLVVTTSSLYAPTGLSVLSENDISGMVDASGILPVLAAVALEGSLPTSGSAGTTYSCGNEEVGIDSDSIAAAGIDAAGYNAGYGSAFGARAGALGLEAGYGSARAGAFGSGAYAPRARYASTFKASPRECY